MAEFVERRLERGLGELEEMVRVGLFTGQELRSIIAKRKRLEYSVQRYEKSVDDHLQYIKYEISLLDLIRIRRKRIGYDFKFNDIEGSIGKRCHARLLKAETKYAGHMEVWKLHVDLCKKLNWNGMASQVFTRLLQFHSDKPEVWIQAASFELNDNGSPDNARELCLKGLRWHPNNPDIWRHHLSVELKIAHKVFQRADILNIPYTEVVKDSDPIATGKVAMVVADNAMKTIPDVNFAASLYELVVTLGSTEKLPGDLWRPVADYILAQMEELSRDNSLYWKQRAQFCLLPVRLQQIKTEHDRVNAEEAAFVLLDSNVAQNNTESMWTAYMDFIVELYASDQEEELSWLELQRKRFHKGNDVFQQAEERKYVNFSRYICWINQLIVRRRKQDAVVLLEKATALCPPNRDDFVRLISAHESAGSDSTIIVGLITRAKTCLNKNDPDVWRQLLDWQQQHQPDAVETTFRDGLRQVRSVVAVVAQQYIQWAYANGVTKGRKMYTEVHKMPGALTENLVKWTIAEEKRLESPMVILRKILDVALLALGGESVDLWIEYILLELKYTGGDPMKISKLALKAQRTLQPQLVSLFVSLNSMVLLNVDGSL